MTVNLLQWDYTTLFYKSQEVFEFFYFVFWWGSRKDLICDGIREGVGKGVLILKVLIVL